jgi:hypothetical protein
VRLTRQISLTSPSTEPTATDIEHKVWPNLWPGRIGYVWPANPKAAPRQHLNIAGRETHGWALTGGLGHALRRNAAGAFGPDLAKKLSQLVKMEKNVMRSLELVAKERMEVAVCDPHPLYRFNSRLTHCSNNCRSGASPAMKMFQTSPTSWECCYTK